MDYQTVWEQGLRHIESRIPKQAFETWFKPVHCEGLLANTLTLSTPNRFQGDWLRDHYASVIINEIESITQEKDLKLLFIIREEVSVVPLGSPLPSEAPTSPRTQRHGLLNPKYTFGSFVVGACNQFAHAASRAVAEVPAKQYNPLFIYGGVGLGKTHILNAVGNYVLQQNPNTKIAYLSSEHFTNEVINSIRYNRMVDFRNRYRNIDILIIDDIQFIQGKERTQEEFFHTFNTLYEAQKQIVISSDRFPNEMPTVEERLRSRFQWGLIADMQPPDLETKIAILKKKAEVDRIHLPDDVCLLLATNINTNIRELEGSLIRVNAFASFTNQTITQEVARHVLKDTIPDPKKAVTVEEIQKTVTEHFHLKIADLKSKRRTKTLVLPRQIAMFLSREMTDLSFPEIGRQFGGKDHTTVMYACKQVEQGKATDKGLKKLLDQLTQKIRGLASYEV